MCTTRVHTALSTYSHSLVSSHVWLLYAHIVWFHQTYGCYIRTLSGFITILTLYGFIQCIVAIYSHSLVSSNVWLLYTHIVWFHQMYGCYIFTLSGFIKCMIIRLIQNICNYPLTSTCSHITFNLPTVKVSKMSFITGSYQLKLRSLLDNRQTF